ncbi:ATP synthase F0 subunit B [Acetobacter sp. AN02]|uniref:ATP synthase F0 subunit B n=1 Tax=Acetobacter sp. AN02 TaxID=2894186 RepID=UPI0024341883|nr:ATP synthase F0 subunit B [Acetobacter sp. AN02]MDG6093824.1 ATP synthase F0 subunit B [Acetobacter sp. AN02]
MSSLFHEAGFWFAVSFVLFFVLFGKKVWTPLAAMLDSHANRVRQDLDEAARLRREAEQMLEDATRDREHALAEAQATIEQARKHAADLAWKARSEAEELLSRREQQAKDRIAAAERAALEDVRAAALEAAFDAARRVMSDSVAGGTDERLIDEAMTALPVALSGRAA